MAVEQSFNGYYFLDHGVRDEEGVLRVQNLLKMKEYELVLQDVKGFFGKMEGYTGTLWEYRQLVGSYDHGFASYAFVVIHKALEGQAGLLGIK